MVRSHVILLLTVAVAVTTSTSIRADSPNGLNLQRVRRQQESTTTAAPPKQRPSNIFSLLSVLLRETRDDARRAFREIGTIFNSQFAEMTTRSPRPFNGQSVSTTTGASSSSSEGGDDVSTTTEPYRISRQQFNGILNSNFRGILTLFGKELTNSIRDSGKNVVQFGRDFRDQIRPYVTLNRKT